MKKGVFYGIGTGPGDPELITLKAVRILTECDVIAVPCASADKSFAYSVAKAAVPAVCEKTVLCIDMPMTRDASVRDMAERKGAERIADALVEGKDVCFVTIGDPTVYSTYMYLQRRIADMGYECCIISGVTSFCAAAAELGISLCEGMEQLHIIPGAGDEEKKMQGTRVYMKDDIKKILPRLKGSIVQAVENCGTDRQRIYRCADDIPDDAGYFTVIIAKEDK